MDFSFGGIIFGYLLKCSTLIWSDKLCNKYDESVNIMLISVKLNKIKSLNLSKLKF